jgi:hypothetical protein
MRLPNFTAEYSLTQIGHTFSMASGRFLSEKQQVQPQRLVFGSCVQLCGGDPDCIACCQCVRRGGHPWFCCF